MVKAQCCVIEKKMIELENIDINFSCRSGLIINAATHALNRNSLAM